MIGYIFVVFVTGKLIIADFNWYRHFLVDIITVSLQEFLLGFEPASHSVNEQL